MPHDDQRSEKIASCRSFNSTQLLILLFRVQFPDKSQVFIFPYNCVIVPLVLESLHYYPFESTLFQPHIHSYLHHIIPPMASVISLLAFPWLGALVALAMFILVNLSGVTTLPLLQRLYFSKADHYYWTMYSFCRINANSDTCTPNFAAYPYTPYVLKSSITNEQAYYYLLRVAYGFLVGALAFTFLSNVIALFCLFLRSPRSLRWFEISLWVAYIIGLIGVAIETGIHVSGSRALSLSVDTQLGVRMFIFMWVGVGLLFLSVLVLMCSPSPQQTQLSSKEQYQADDYNQGYEPYYQGGYYGQQDSGPQYHQQGYLAGYLHPQRVN